MNARATTVTFPFITVGISFVLLFAIIFGTQLMIQPSSFDYRSKAASIEIFSDSLQNQTSAVNYAISPPEKVSFGSSCGSEKGMIVNSAGSGVMVTKTLSPRSNVSIRVRFYDDIAKSTGSFFAVRDSAGNQIVVGVRSQFFKDTYFYRIGNMSVTNNDVDTHIPRTNGWHDIEIISTLKGSTAKIDGISTATMPALRYLTNPNPAQAPEPTPVPPYMQYDQNAVGFNELLTVPSIIVFVSTWVQGSGCFNNLVVSTLDYATYPGSVEAEKHFVRKFVDDGNFYTDEDFQRVLHGGATIADETVPTLARVNANYFFASALLCRKLNSDAYCAKAKDAIRVALKYFDNWIVERTFYNVSELSLFYGTWVIWDKLDPSLQRQLASAIEYQANAIAVQDPRNQYSGDSAAEESGWLANDLRVAAMMFPNHPKAQYWKERSDVYAFHALTKSPGESYGGVTTQTINPDGFIENHGPVNPLYNLCPIMNLTNAVLTANKIGQPIDTSIWFHNIPLLWNNIQAKINPTNGLYRDLPIATDRGGKDDWAHDAHHMINTFYNVHALKSEINKANPNNPLIVQTDFYDSFLQFEWYVKHEYVSFPKKGWFCQAYASNPVCRWRSNDFMINYQNSVEGAERHGMALLLQDPTITIRQLPFPSPTTVNLTTMQSTPNADHPYITSLVQSLGISKYAAYYLKSSTATQVINIDTMLSNASALRVYFYDEAGISGKNVGLKSADGTMGMSFIVMSGRYNSSTDPKCTVVSITAKKGVDATCYLVRMDANTSANKQTYIPRTVGWHYVDFYTDSSQKVHMRLDGLFDYVSANPMTLTKFYVSGSNWGFPSNGIYLVANAPIL